MLDIKKATIGQHLQPLSELLEQMQFMLTDPAPGSITAVKNEVLGQVDQMQNLLNEARSRADQLLSVTDLLEQQINSLISQLTSASVTKVEISGDAATVMSQLQAQLPQIASGHVYGVMFLADVPNAQQAIGTLLGLARQLNPTGDK